MKKFTLSIFCLLFFVNFSFCQLADGSIAPDFTAYDIEGNQYNLYDLLDQGKTVILDVSATWCGPCWSFHNSGVLESIWEEYGPDGTDEIFIFFIEGDGSTSSDDLYGTGSNTLGNWVEGTMYPIIDNSSIANRYDIAYFPTLYQICADRTLNNLSQQYDPVDFINQLNECNYLEGTLNARLRDFEEYNGASCGNVEFAPSFLMQNMGTDEIVSAQIELFVDGELSQSRDWTGSLSSYELAEIDLDIIDEDGSYSVDVQINNINGSTDDFPFNNSYQYELQLPTIADNKAKVIINTDDYGNELYWVLYSPTGQIVAKGGNEAVGLGNTDNGLHNAPDNPNSYPNNSEIIVDIELNEEGCHFLLISDYAGDGICCSNGEGSFKILDSNNNLVLETSDYGANYNKQFDRLFFSNVVNVEMQSSTKVSPNPNMGIFTIELESQYIAEYVVQINDLSGKTLYSKVIDFNNSSGVEQIQTQLSQGLYIVSLQNEQSFISKKLVITN